MKGKAGEIRARGERAAQCRRNSVQRFFVSRPLAALSLLFYNRPRAHCRALPACNRISPLRPDILTLIYKIVARTPARSAPLALSSLFFTKSPPPPGGSNASLINHKRGRGAVPSAPAARCVSRLSFVAGSIDSFGNPAAPAIFAVKESLRRGHRRRRRERLLARSLFSRPLPASKNRR